MITLSKLAAVVDAEYRGDADLVIRSLATLQDAPSGALSFLANSKYANFLKNTQAAAVILHPDMLGACPCAAIVTDNPYLAYAKISHLFDSAPKPSSGIHAAAVVHPSAVVHETATVAANAVIEANAVLGENVAVGSGSVIGEGSTVGANSRIWANVTIYHGVKVGEATIIHAGSVIGADGFGFAPAHGVWQKIAQIGGVVIGDRCEIGANTTIDRGAIGDTVIANDVILDNQIQIAHNVTVGEGTAMAAKVGVAGSTNIGKHCLVSGAAGILGHLDIADGVQVSAMTLVSRSLTQPGVYSSGTTAQKHDEWKRNVARFRRLDDMAKRLKKLEKRSTD